jgi:hypothetical protein
MLTALSNVSTLDEEVMTTLMRDVRRVADNIRLVLLPKSAAASEVCANQLLSPAPAPRPCADRRGELRFQRRGGTNAAAGAAAVGPVGPVSVRHSAGERARLRTLRGPPCCSACRPPCAMPVGYCSPTGDAQSHPLPVAAVARLGAHAARTNVDMADPSRAAANVH